MSMRWNPLVVFISYCIWVVPRKVVAKIQHCLFRGDIDTFPAPIQSLEVEFECGDVASWVDFPDAEYPEFIPEFKVDAGNYFYLKRKGKWVYQGRIVRLVLG